EVSGARYGAPFFVCHTNTGPSYEPAARRRPSGLRSSEPAGSVPTESGGRIGRPLRTSAGDTEPELSLAISVRPPLAKIASFTPALPITSGDPTRRPVATSQIPTVPEAPGTAIRLESGLKEIDCAPPPGGLVVVRLPLTRPPRAF